MNTTQPFDSAVSSLNGHDLRERGMAREGREHPPRIAALPTYTDSGLGSHLARVDELLDSVLTELQELWQHEFDDGGRLDVLADQDLPSFLAQLLTSGGKRIRPAMCYLGWLSASESGCDAGREHVVTVGAALELLHIFALIHDDVMDESASRRGHPSVHAQAARLHKLSHGHGSASRFGDSIAMLAGDLAHSEADQLAAGLPPEMRRIWRILVVELVCGQRRDLTGSAAGRRDLGHARQVARMKSGSYTVERPLQLGAAAASASPAVLAQLLVYGRQVGEAFALRDDLLGVWGDPAVTGKPAGDDLVSGKPTVILSLAQRRVTGAARTVLGRVGSAHLSESDVRLLQVALRDCGVVDAVESMIDDHLDLALNALGDDVLHPDGIAGLTQMAHQIAWRNR